MIIQDQTALTGEQDGPVVLVNTFTAKPGMLPCFVSVQTSEYKRLLGRVEGWRGNRLHVSLDGASAVNYALFDSLQAYKVQLIKNLLLDQVKRATLALAQMATILKLPVILTSSQEERAQGPLLPEAYEKRIKRAGIVNAWNDEAFANAVRATGRKQIIMAGVTTDVCLIYPSISAVEEGFQVQAVMDASGSPFDLSEQLSRQRMHDAGVVLTTSNTFKAGPHLRGSNSSVCSSLVCSHPF